MPEGLKKAGVALAILAALAILWLLARSIFPMAVGFIAGIAVRHWYLK